MSAAAKPEATIGVGDGPGQLFVHGSHEAVKRVQSIILEVERLRAEVARLSPSDEETRYTADQDWTGLSGATAWHLAERHGEGWAGIGAMMEAWRDAEVQRITAGLAADLARAQERAQAALDKLEAAQADRLSANARAERYMAERNAARLEAQRDVGETMRKLREERDEARAELARVREVLRDARDALIVAECPQPDPGEPRDAGCPVCAALIRIDAALAAAKGE